VFADIRLSDQFPVGPLDRMGRRAHIEMGSAKFCPQRDVLEQFRRLSVTLVDRTHQHHSVAVPKFVDAIPEALCPFDTFGGGVGEEPSIAKRRRAQA